MNVNCTICGDLFGELDHVDCDGCQRIVHRQCGAYELIHRDGETLAYFFCQHCREDEEEDMQ